MKLMKKCVNCKKYTLELEQCPYCGGKLVSPHPPRFSLVKAQKYARYTLIELREKYSPLK